MSLDLRRAPSFNVPLIFLGRFWKHDFKIIFNQLILLSSNQRAYQACLPLPSHSLCSLWTCELGIWGNNRVDDAFEHYIWKELRNVRLLLIFVALIRGPEENWWSNTPPKRLFQINISFYFLCLIYSRFPCITNCSCSRGTKHSTRAKISECQKVDGL